MRRYLLLFLIHATVMSQAQTPELVFDVFPGTSGSYPSNLTPFDSQLYFTANNGVHGTELWRYDGMNPPQLIYDLYPGPEGGASTVVLNKSNLIQFQNKLYFSGNDGVTGYVLYEYDGVNPPVVAAGTPDANPAYNPIYFTVLGERLYFSAFNAATGRELYSYDGIHPPVLIELQPGAGSSEPISLVTLNDKLYFLASTSSGGQMYVYDPAINTTIPVSTFATEPEWGITSFLCRGEGRLWFIGDSPANGQELYSFDGATMWRCTDLEPAAIYGLYGSQVAYYNGAVYFAGNTDWSTPKFYRFKPADSTTTLMHNIDFSNGGNPSFCDYAGKLYFAITSLPGLGIWATDGDTTYIVADLASILTSSPGKLTAWNGSLYFIAQAPGTGMELYRLTDPTASIINTAFSGSAKLYPNPAGDKTNLEISLKAPKTLSINLMDISGKTLWKNPAKEYPAGTFTIEIPLQQLSSGTYIYQLTDKERRVLLSGKVNKQ